MFICALIALMGLSCAHRRTVITPVADEPYKIGREDVLDVSVWKDPELSRIVPVRPDGFISLPMIGEVQAEGKTATQLASVVQDKLAAYVQQPRVTVIVHEVNSSKVFITGEVTHPGAYPLKGRVSLLQALALAGGFSAFANTDSIVVIRPGQGRIPVRYRELITEENARSQFLLVSGDTVVVP
jgi:polysaccharide export outer membrane protein